MSGFLERLLDTALDASVVLSFDRTGYRRHAKRFDPRDLDVDLSGKTALVTGANSGLGKAACRELARRKARVVMLCRDEGRGGEALDEIRRDTGSRQVELALLDVADLSSVEEFAATSGPKAVHILVNNAAVLPPLRAESPDGLELTLATNLVGPFLLTELLLPRLAASGGGRVVNVSSGGMYSQRLDVGALVAGGGEPFDGVVAYARTKRALVVLTGLQAVRHASTGVFFASMHPGWAETPGVRSSLPRFHAVTKAILRTPEEGADTVVWLAASPAPAGRSGLFWFDRQPVDEHLVPFTREAPEERERLWAELERLSGLGVRTGRRR